MNAPLDLTIPGYRILGTLHESSPRIVLLAEKEVSGQHVVLKTLGAHLPRRADVAELRREYQIASSLRDVPGVIQVHGLVQHGEGNVAIEMEHFGQSLAHVLEARRGKPLDLPQFYHIATHLSEILGTLHERGIVHKDIVPRNILFDEVTSTLRIIDFGISSELARERQERTLSRRLEGSLPYISPEQTGRMNRDLDYRSDYYSLGITFFELLTGRLPFEGKTPLEWVHRHISQKPPLCHRENTDVPLHLSFIVAKLMAKNAEDRYQSTFGLLADLKRSRDSERHQAFELGKDDVSRRFQIPQRLYGRKQELSELKARFSGVTHGETSLCLISGFSGVGKSALAHELSRSIVSENGFLISGKFDQFQQNSAYSAFATAFRALLKDLLAESEESLQLWKEKLTAVLGKNARLLIDLLPELELILGSTAPVPDLPPTEAQNRFQLTFLDFVRVLASADHPLVLFMDDLQWSDVPSLNLLQRLLTARKLSHLFVIGAYRENSVDATHPLQVALGELEKVREVVHLRLLPLPREAVDELISDTLHVDAKACADFSQVVFDKARGNPLFVSELLKTLYEQGALAFDPERGHFSWNTQAVSSASLGEDVVEFMVTQLEKLPERTQQALQLAACIGNTFDLKTLAVIFERSSPATAEALRDALLRHFVVPLSDVYRYAAVEGADLGMDDFNPIYKFQHDRVQQAAYELIAEEKKQAVHLSVGRLMLKHSTPLHLSEQLIEIVGHLNRGRHLMGPGPEREHLIELNLAAGISARRSSAYFSAMSFLQTGRELLPEGSFETHYDLSVSLTTELQQCCYLTADYEGADLLTDELLQQVKTPLEKAEALSARTRQYATIGKMRESIAAAIEGLALLGVNMTETPDASAIREQIAEVQTNLAGRKIESLISAPRLAEGRDLVAIRLLMEIFPAAFLSGSGDLFPYLVLKSVNLSLVSGNSPESAFAYAAYGMLLCGALNDPATGLEYGKLAVSMNDRLDGIALKSRVIYVYAMFIHHWSHHWSSMTPWFLRGIEAGYQSGDLLYLAYSAQDCIIWDPKLDLDIASAEQEKYLRIVKDCEYRDSYDSGSLFLQMQLNFRGLTDSRYSLSTATFDEEAVLSGMLARRFMTGVANYHIYKVEIHVMYGDFVGAMKHVKKQDQLMASSMSLPQLARYYITSFVARCAVLSFMAPEEQESTRERLSKDFAQMSLWARHSPENFEHLRLMMAGELARLAGDLHGAASLHDQAVDQARSQEFRRDEGMANELAAQSFLALGLHRAAEGYLRAAHYIYYRWGAKEKVKQLTEAYPTLFRSGSGHPRPSSMLSTSTAQTDSLDANALDLASVIKASQAISGEIVLDQFWKTTLAILLENAGGERGRFILRKDGHLFVQAETGKFDASRSEPEENLPLSIIHSALRTDQPVVLDSACLEGRFGSDPYVERVKPKSILCIPLKSQGKFEGAIYLENNQMTGAFDGDRVEVIRLLSAQAVISVENAQLYQEQLRLTQAQQRFVPSQFLESLGHSDIGAVELGQYVTAEMTVLFSDLREFTDFSEQVGPDHVIQLLNRYFGYVAEPITEAGGFIDSYIGDAIMALFGVGAERAVRAAIGMRHAMAAFNEESRQLGQQTLKMGLGLNTGPLVLGTVGSAERLKCGVVGDTVNLASRIEQLTKVYRCPLLISEHTLARLPEPSDFSMRKLDRVAVKGKKRSVTLYEVLDAESEERQREKERLLGDFRAAQETYESRKFDMAEEALRKLGQADPKDPIYEILASRCQRYRHTPPPEDWDGIETLDSK